MVFFELNCFDMQCFKHFNASSLGCKEELLNRTVVPTFALLINLVLLTIISYLPSSGWSFTSGTRFAAVK